LSLGLGGLVCRWSIEHNVNASSARGADAFPPDTGIPGRDFDEYEYRRSGYLASIGL